MSWFPEKNDPELERLAELAEDLRRELFMWTEFRRPPPLMRETQEQKCWREKHNEEAWMAWSNQTRRLILGQPKEGTDP